jgi:hypothetical protein
MDMIAPRSHSAHPAHTTQHSSSSSSTTTTGHDKTRHWLPTRRVPIRYDTTQDENEQSPLRSITPTQTNFNLQQKDLTLLHVRLVGPRLKDNVDAERCPPLVGRGLCAVWDRHCCHARGTRHGSITISLAGQLSGPHRRRCSHCAMPACHCSLTALQRTAYMCICRVVCQRYSALRGRAGGASVVG